MAWRVMRDAVRYSFSRCFSSGLGVSLSMRMPGTPV